MRIVGCVLILIFFSINMQLYASGRAEEVTVPNTINNEWILCITEFDISSLAPEKLVVASVITQKIVERLSLISYRTRISTEYYHHIDVQWAQARSAAARTLALRQDERSALIFRGDPGWRFRQDLARIEAQIETARAAFEEIDNNPPLINREPVFRLTAGNMASSFPPPPAEGNEHRFSMEQRADAFLAGSIIDFHGRFYVSLRLYIAYTRSFVWEDSIIFSADDLEMALDEITRRLIIVLSGNNPAAIAVTAEPADSLILINRAFAGRGSTGVLEQAPGTFIITASAPEHESLTFETELAPGELVEIDFVLAPIPYGVVEIFGDSFGGSLYHGSLYVGEAPLTLRLPLNSMEFFELKTPDNRRGTIVFNTQDSPDQILSVPMQASIPPPRGQVDRERRRYYLAWGGTWITGIAAWIVYHTVSGSITAIHAHETPDPNFIARTNRMNTISLGLNIAVGATAVLGFVQIGRYLAAANRSSPPVLRQ